ncbi:MAG: hypothetical protein PUB40_00140 [Lachnospiraceae bacterium]|nr:hypothetical protein [Lachnospiraceae bacterium]
MMIIYPFNVQTVVLLRQCISFILCKNSFCFYELMLIQQITVYDDHFTVRFKSGLEIDINE